MVFCAAVVGGDRRLVLVEGGTTLDAPADPSSSDYPARPEWYFLSLFQMLKMFPGRIEVVGTIVIPSAPGALDRVIAVLGPGLAAWAGPYSGLRLRLRGRRLCGIPHGPGALRRCPRHLVSGGEKKG